MEDDIRQELEAAMVTIEALKQRLIQKEFEIVDFMSASIAAQQEQFAMENHQHPEGPVAVMDMQEAAEDGQ